MPGSLHDNEFGRLMTQPDQIGALETQAPYVFVPGIDEHECARRRLARGW